VGRVAIRQAWQSAELVVDLQKPQDRQDLLWVETQPRRLDAAGAEKRRQQGTNRHLGRSRA
jgi:hypothetical protein